MRRTIALGTMGFLALLATALVTWGQEGPDRVGWQGQQRSEDRGRAGGFGRQEMGWGHGRHGFGRGAGLLHLADNPRVRAELNLTDEQVGRLHKLAVDSEKSSVQTRAELELRGIELREMLRAENPDHGSILKKVDEISALRGQKDRQHMETLLAARNVLTPEQQKKLRSFREQRGMAGPGHERRMEHGEGHARPFGRPGAPPAPAVPPAHSGGPAVQ
jgi:Spy/CpxP family protein refolding chaperone